MRKILSVLFIFSVIILSSNQTRAIINSDDKNASVELSSINLASTRDSGILVASNFIGKYDGNYEGSFIRERGRCHSRDLPLRAVVKGTSLLIEIFHEGADNSDKKKILFSGDIKRDGSFLFYGKKGVFPKPDRYYRVDQARVKGSIKDGMIRGKASMVTQGGGGCYSKFEASTKEVKARSEEKENQKAQFSEMKLATYDGVYEGKLEDERKSCFITMLPLKAVVNDNIIKLEIEFREGIANEKFQYSGEIQSSGEFLFYGKRGKFPGSTNYSRSNQARIRGSVKNGVISGKIVMPPTNAGCYSKFEATSKVLMARLEESKIKAREKALANTEEAKKARAAVEAKRKQLEVAQITNQAELKRKLEEAAKKAEVKRKRQEAAKKAEAKRKRQEAAKKAEAKRKQEEAAKKAERERQEREAKAKREEAERLKQEVLNTFKQSPKTSFIFEGSEKSIHFLFNGSGNAQNSVKNLDGDVEFSGSRASICAAVPFEIESEHIDYIKVYFESEGIGKTAVRKKYTPCPISGSNTNDLIALERKSLQSLNPEKLSSLLQTIENTPLTPLFKFDYDVHLNKLKQQSKKSAELLSALRSAPKSGYGLIKVSNSKQGVCTSENAPKMVQKILSTLRENSRVKLKSLDPSRLFIETANKVFIQTKKKQCQYIFGEGSDLHRIVLGLERDNIKLVLHHEWVDDTALDRVSSQKSNVSKKSEAANDNKSTKKQDKLTDSTNKEKTVNDETEAIRKKRQLLEEKEKKLEEREKEIKLREERKKRQAW